VSYLTASETVELKKHLEEKTYLYVKDICHYVLQIFSKSYSISGMTRWLRGNDFRYKKPHAVPAKMNEEEQQKFIEDYTLLK
jgi:transposase